MRRREQASDFLVAEYTGSSGTHVAPGIRAKLDELQKIAEHGGES